MHEAAAFFSRLASDPSREWFAAHREDYERDVRTPLLTLLEELGGAWRVYRPYRDTRFATDKAPLKQFAGAVQEGDDGTGRFVRVDARGLFVASGLPMPAPDQLRRLRAAVADATIGTAFIEAVAEVEAAGRSVTPGRFPPLTGAPRGYRADHPRIAWLRWKGVELPARLGIPAWADAGALVRAAWAVGQPVDGWLGRHVGPSALSPEERFARGWRQPSR